MLDQAGILMAQGNTIACERISGVNDNMMQSHFHDYFEIYYLESGERFHMIHDQLCCIHPGQFILFPPYVMHHSYGAENVSFRRLLVYFHAEEVQSPRVLEALKASGGVYRPEGAARRSTRNLIEAMLAEQENPSAFQKESLHALLNLLVLSVIRQEHEPVVPQSKTRIEKVISYIHTHYHEDIHLEQLAQNFYISPYFLCREFKRHTNRTIVQYLHITRVMNAQRKLMETSKNITEISKETGFSNLTHFNRVFKSAAGMTPTEYRKGFKTIRVGGGAPHLFTQPDGLLIQSEYVQSKG